MVNGGRCRVVVALLLLLLLLLLLRMRQRRIVMVDGVGVTGVYEKGAKWKQIDERCPVE